MSLYAYSDLDWADDSVDIRFTSRFLIFLGANHIYWAIKKQSIVSRSSIEVEYRSLAIIVAELSWQRLFLCELHIFGSKPPIIWCDNMFAIHIVKIPIFHGK